MNRLPLAQQVQVIRLLVEGNSLRSTSRITGVAINTVMSLLVRAGQNCQEMQNQMLKNLSCARLQVDEAWCFVGKKSINMDKAEEGVGDTWVYVAIDPDTKLVPHWLVGSRTAHDAHNFIEELGFRVSGKVQLSSDGFNAYTAPVVKYGYKWDYAQYIKLYERGGTNKLGPRDKYIGHQLKTMNGEPFERDISTSICERQNLTMRMSVKRMARKTNAHSKKLDNHKAAIALHFAYYNMCRIHSSLRITPAMASGVVDRVWDIEDLLKSN